MTQSAVRYDRWKAPAEDGGMLIWPDPARLLRETEDNHQRLASAHSVSVQNVPLPELRTAMRRWIGHSDDAALLFATGHQTELHHPGVWAKNALIDAAARRAGGQAYHFAVDTDEPKHLQLRWPGGAAPLTEPQAPSVEWSGLLDPPSPAHLAEVSRLFDRAAAQWRFVPLVPNFLASLRRLSLESLTLPAALTNAVHELDWKLGLRHHALVVSPLCMSEPYLAFVHHVLSRADAFAADYNAALEQYRIENKIRSPGRPMPNLNCVPDGCEVPFWLDDVAAGRRSRAAVAREGAAFALRLPNGERFPFDAHADGWIAARELSLFLRRNEMRLAPRALTLTAVLRLLVADQFVHGIGGGQYDQVLDALIARHFNLDPPRFSVTTASLFFPDAVGQTRVCLPCIEQEGRRLRHGILGDEKLRMAAQIEALPRRSSQRSELFYQMHDRMAAASAAERLQSWQKRYQDAEIVSREQRLLFDRELFYAIQSEARLQSLIRRYVEAFAG